MGKTRSTASLIELLRNWNKLNARLMKLDEIDVAWLLAHEKRNSNRITFVMRLHSRMNKLRRERERQELARGRL